MCWVFGWNCDWSIYIDIHSITLYIYQTQNPDPLNSENGIKCWLMAQRTRPLAKRQKKQMLTNQISTPSRIYAPPWPSIYTSKTHQHFKCTHFHTFAIIIRTTSQPPFLVLPQHYHHHHPETTRRHYNNNSDDDALSSSPGCALCFSWDTCSRSIRSIYSQLMNGPNLLAK